MTDLVSKFGLYPLKGGGFICSRWSATRITTGELCGIRIFGDQEHLDVRTLLAGLEHDSHVLLTVLQCLPR